jgi:orotidine-5'-phosphate decarboxylase
MMYVVGATQGELLAEVRKLAPRHFLLVPGVGAQGGSLDDVAKYGMIDECGLLVNASRSIIYASNGEDFAQAAGAEAARLATRMKELLAEYKAL